MSGGISAYVLKNGQSAVNDINLEEENTNVVMKRDIGVFINDGVNFAIMHLAD